jgi:hypothetical protein
MQLSFFAFQHRASADEILVETGMLHLLQVDGSVVGLDDDFYACIKAESESTGISLAQAYGEELAARENLDRITPPLEILLDWGSKSSQPDNAK